MHLSLFTTFSPNILVFPPNIFDKPMPVAPMIYLQLFLSWDVDIYSRPEDRGEQKLQQKKLQQKVQKLSKSCQPFLGFLLC